MGKRFIIACNMILCFCTLVQAQLYYNPYQQAYEMGRRMMQQQMDAYNNNPANAPAITGAALQSVAQGFMSNDPQQQYDNAFERLKHAGYGLEFTNAIYWMGVLAECGLVTGEDVDDALQYYDLAADEGHASAKQRLRQLKNGADVYDSEDVLNTLREMSLAVNSLTLSTMPSTDSSSRSSSNSSRTVCAQCGGSGYDRTAYNNAAASASGWMPPHHNSPGLKCAVCASTSDHYHYPCSACHGYGRVQR